MAANPDREETKTLPKYKKHMKTCVVAWVLRKNQGNLFS